MRRLGAALIAVLMVVVALYVRGRIDDDGRSGNATGGSVVHLRCSTELEAVCTDLSNEDSDVDVTVADAGATFDALVAVPDAQRRTVGFDAWLVPEPWPALVDVQRGANGLEPMFSGTTDRIARSPLVLVVRADRRPVLEVTPECAGTVTWKCIGQVAGRSWDSIGGQAQWGQVRPGHSDPTRSATGLLVLNQATRSFLGTEEYDRFQLENTDDYGDWLSSLEQAIPRAARTSPSPFLDLLQQPVYDAVGTTEAEAGPVLTKAARDRRRQFALLYPEPVVTADVVLAPVVGADTAAADSLATSSELRTALAANGWRVPGEPRATGVRATPALPPNNGLPGDPGALLALQDTWGGAAG